MIQKMPVCLVSFFTILLVDSIFFPFSNSCVKSPSSPLFFATLFCQGGSLEIEIMVIARFSLQQSRQFIFIAKWHFRSKNSTIS